MIIGVGNGRSSMEVLTTACERMDRIRIGVGRVCNASVWGWQRALLAYALIDLLKFLFPETPFTHLRPAVERSRSPQERETQT